MMKLALRRTAIRKEDPVTSAAVYKFIRVTSLGNCRPNKCFTEFKEQTHLNITDQRRLCESGLHEQIAAKKPLLKDTNNKDILDIALWSDESKCEIFYSNSRVFVRRRVGERMISACVVPTVKHGGGGVMVCGSHREAWRRRCDGVWFQR